MPAQRKNILIHLLQQVKEVLDKHNIEFWLECGTLLGAIREGKFLEWEYDIDLGVWQERMTDIVKILISKELHNRNFNVRIFENHIHINVEGEKYHADINLYRLTNNGKAIIPRVGPVSLKDRLLYYFTVLLSNPYDSKLDPRKTVGFIKRLIKSFFLKITYTLPSLLRKRLARTGMIIYKKFGERDVSWVIPSDYFTTLSTIKFYEMEFRVPAKTEEYLAYRYGKDWRTPKKDWVTTRDDGAVMNAWRKNDL